MFAKSQLPFFGPLGADYDTAWARTPVARVVRYAMLEVITRPVVTLLAHPRFVSRDRVESIDGPVIFVLNHSSHLDTSLALTALPRRLRDRTVVAAGSDYFFDKHFKAFIWSLWMGVIPLEREKVSRASIEAASKILLDGWNLVIFPEGTRGETDFTVPFKPGAAFLAVRNNVPIVPIHLEGTRRVFTPYTRRIRVGRTRVTFGSPMTPRPGEKARDFNERVETAVGTAADEGRTDWWSSMRRAASGETPSLRGPEGVEGWRRHWAATATRPAAPKKQWPR